jgi:hypothetical protein
MRSFRPVWLVVVAVLVCVAGVVASARGASSAPRAEAWGLSPGTVGSGALPRVQSGVKTLVVDLQAISATSIDNAPTGTSQGDEIVVAGALFKAGKPAGSLQATETATRVVPNGNGFSGKLVVTAVCQLAGGQITFLAVTGFNNANPVKAAILGGTGAYNKAQGQMFVSQGPNQTTRFTFYLTPG